MCLKDDQYALVHMLFRQLALQSSSLNLIYVAVVFQCARLKMTNRPATRLLRRRHSGTSLACKQVTRAFRYYVSNRR